MQEKEIKMKGEDKSKWHIDLKKQIYHHKQSTEILSAALGGDSNKIRS